MERQVIVAVAPAPQGKPTRLCCQGEEGFRGVLNAVFGDQGLAGAKAPAPAGQIHDQKAGKCVPAKSSSLTDQERYQAVRELAYAQQYAAAAQVLDAMSDPLDDRVLTYRGFLMRKTGRLEQAGEYYRSALNKNPNNLLVRSYMGQGFVEAGDLVAARGQHDEILARGGKGTWAEESLRKALSSGQTYRY